MASVNANPNKQIRNKRFSRRGFRATANIKAPNTVPIPIPAPAKPITADPAPINFPN